MSRKTRFALMLLMSALLAAPTFAQINTNTPEPTAAAPVVVATVQPTSASETTEPQVDATDVVLPEVVLTEDETQTTVGSLTIVHPKTWFASAGPEDKTLLTNVDLMALAAGTELPPETVLAQMQVFSISQLPETMLPIESPTEILQAVPAEDGQPAPAISEVTVDGVVLGRGDFSKPDNENVIYIRLLDKDTFLLAVLASMTPGKVIENEATFQRAFATLQLDWSAPFVEDLTRYDAIEQTVSPEGFPQLGSADAPVKIIEVGSFDCPVCRSFHDLAIPTLLERIQKGEVQYTYVPVFGTGHVPLGERAGFAALCALDQGKFWQYHDGLFNWQDFGSQAFVDTRLENGAEALGLDMIAFNECLQTRAKLPILQAAIDYAQASPDFKGTPLVLVNGISVNWSRLPTIIDEALIAAENATPEVAPAGTVEATAAVEVTANAVEATPTATALP
jgi:protein-disulfide isomerase